KIPPGETATLHRKIQLIEQITRYRRQGPVGELDEAAIRREHGECRFEDFKLCLARHQKQTQAADDGVNRATIEEAIRGSDRAQLARVAAYDLHTRGAGMQVLTKHLIEIQRQQVGWSHAAFEQGAGEYAAAGT